MLSTVPGCQYPLLLMATSNQKESDHPTPNICYALNSGLRSSSEKYRKSTTANHSLIKNDIKWHQNYDNYTFPKQCLIFNWMFWNLDLSSFRASILRPAILHKIRATVPMNRTDARAATWTSTLVFKSAGRLFQVCYTNLPIMVLHIQLTWTSSQVQ